MKDRTIIAVSGREILDSRGNPTVEAEVKLTDGTIGRASSPSGASTGQFEALELRDGDRDRYDGKGVLQAVANINGPIRDLLLGKDPVDQQALDRAQALYDHAPCGYLSLDANLRFVNINQTLLDWLGYTREELVAHGRSVEEIRQIIGCDALIYQDLESLKTAIHELNPAIQNMDASCFDGIYVTGDINASDIVRMQQERPKAADTESDTSRLTLPNADTSA